VRANSRARYCFVVVVVVVKNRREFGKIKFREERDDANAKKTRAKKDKDEKNHEKSTNAHRF
jgi:hypothetical protein